jgi:hypothetical protein
MNIYYLVPDRYVGEEFLQDDISKKMEEFLYQFNNRYPTSGPPLHMGALDQALADSLFDPMNVGFCCCKVISEKIRFIFFSSLLH